MTSTLASLSAFFSVTGYPLNGLVGVPGRKKGTFFGCYHSAKRASHYVKLTGICTANGLSSWVSIGVDQISLLLPSRTDVRWLAI